MRSVTSLPPAVVVSTAEAASLSAISGAELAPAGSPAEMPHLLAATAGQIPDQVDALLRARAFAEPLLVGEELTSGENTLAHADATAAILQGIGGSEAMQAACYLVYASMH